MGIIMSHGNATATTLNHTWIRCRHLVMPPDCFKQTVRAKWLPSLQYLCVHSDGAVSHCWLLPRGTCGQTRGGPHRRNQVDGVSPGCGAGACGPPSGRGPAAPRNSGSCDPRPPTSPTRCPCRAFASFSSSSSSSVLRRSRPRLGRRTPRQSCWRGGGGREERRVQERGSRGSVSKEE